MMSKQEIVAKIKSKQKDIRNVTDKADIGSLENDIGNLRELMKESSKSKDNMMAKAYEKMIGKKKAMHGDKSTPKQQKEMNRVADVLHDKMVNDDIVADDSLDGPRRRKHKEVKDRLEAVLKKKNNKEAKARLERDAQRAEDKKNAYDSEDYDDKYWDN